MPAVVDLAAMRDAIADLGGDPAQVNPLIPAELVIDHSVQVDAFASRVAFARNVELEFERNRERYAFLRWGQASLRDFKVVPPGTGICHQVNLEYLARVVEDRDGVAFPDTLVGARLAHDDGERARRARLGRRRDRGGGRDARRAALDARAAGRRASGSRGRLREGATATDLVLTVTELLRRTGVVGKFVEYFGDGVGGAHRRRPRDAREHVAGVRRDLRLLPGRRADARLPAPDRPQRRARRARRGVLPREPALARAGASTRRTRRSSSSTSATSSRRSPGRAGRRTACRSRARSSRSSRRSPTFGVEYANGDDARSPRRSRRATRRPSRRPAAQPSSSRRGRVAVAGAAAAAQPSACAIDGEEVELGHGAVVIAAITSCTNTSNPQVMVAAGLLAKKAVELGLRRAPWVKTSLAPGSRVVTDYYERAGLQTLPRRARLQHRRLRLHDLHRQLGAASADEVSRAIADGDLVACAVLSGNRNFEARIHPEVKANYLASPPLVVAYALAGRMDIDLETEPLGTTPDGATCSCATSGRRREEIADDDRVVGRRRHVPPHLRRRVHRRRDLAGARRRPTGDLYAWEPGSTYVRRPPYFDGLSARARRRSPTSTAPAASSRSATRSRPTTSRRRARSSPTRRPAAT